MHTLIALIKQRTVKIPYNQLALNHEYVNDAKNDAKTLEETKEKLASLEAKKTKSPTDATKIRKLKELVTNEFGNTEDEFTTIKHKF